MKTYYVYILKCFDNSFYTGVTNDLEERLFQHNTGADPRAYTYNKRPLELVYSNEFSEINDAIAFEKQIKGWRREKKLALIEGYTDLLSKLSANYSENK